MSYDVKFWRHFGLLIFFLKCMGGIRVKTVFSPFGAEMVDNKGVILKDKLTGIHWSSPDEQLSPLLLTAKHQPSAPITVNRRFTESQTSPNCSENIKKHSENQFGQ